jgi:hypothetical protein
LCFVFIFLTDLQNLFLPVVIIDLTADHFCPGKKNYENIVEKFANRNDLRFDVILTWEPYGQ